MERIKDRRHKFWYACQDAGITEPEAYICQCYTGYKMSCREIGEHFLEKGIKTSTRNVEYYIQKYGITRSRAEARKVAISKGRVVYKKKSKDELYCAKQIGLKVRMEVLKRDRFRCKLCGNGMHNGYSIEIHHKDGPESVEENLETRCWMCHKGKHVLDREAK